jgi:hypothetical protein
MIFNINTEDVILNYYNDYGLDFDTICANDNVNNSTVKFFRELINKRSEILCSDPFGNTYNADYLNVILYIEDNNKAINIYRLCKYDSSNDEVTLNQININDEIDYNNISIQIVIYYKTLIGKPYMALITEEKKIIVNNNPPEKFCVTVNDKDKTISVKYVYHGTSYPYGYINAPYNFYGNWFTLGLDEESEQNNFAIPFESSAYGISNAPFLIYKYKIKNEMLVFHFNNEYEIEKYFSLFILYFKIKFCNNNNILSIKYYDTHTIRGTANNIEKYNYTQYKNLINLNNQQIPFSTEWQIIKLPSSGDGDKSLAGKICDLYNSDVNHQTNKVSGWVIGGLLHLQNCNPLNNLELVGYYLKLEEFKKIKRYKHEYFTDFNFEMDADRRDCLDFIYVEKNSKNIFIEQCTNFLLNFNVIKNLINNELFYNKYKKYINDCKKITNNVNLFLLKGKCKNDKNTSIKLMETIKKNKNIDLFDVLQCQILEQDTEFLKKVNMVKKFHQIFLQYNKVPYEETVLIENNNW